MQNLDEFRVQPDRTAVLRFELRWLRVIAELAAFLEPQGRGSVLMNITIAGVRYEFSCDRRLSCWNPPPNYRQFLAASGMQLDSIDIRLVLDCFPDTAKMARLFDSGQSWALFRDGDDYCFEYKPTAFQRPFWLARVDGGFSKATVHCGEAITSEDAGGFSVTNPLLYPLDQLLLMHILSGREGALIHAAGLAVRGKGFIFPGKSGAGKSTLSRLVLGREKVRTLSDDRVVARKVGGRHEIFGTPWAGDAGIAENSNYPLSGIFFIRHARENAIREMRRQEAFERLLPVTSIPWYDEQMMSAVLSSCENLVSNIPAYEFSFRPGGEAADLLEKFVSA